MVATQWPFRSSVWGTRMTPPWSGAIQTAWKACFWLGSTLVLLAVTGGIWKTDLKVANPEYLLPTFCVGIGLLVVPAFVAVWEALKSHSSRTIPNVPALTAFKVAFKEPKPDEKHTPPIKFSARSTRNYLRDLSCGSSMRDLYHPSDGLKTKQESSQTIGKTGALNIDQQTSRITMEEPYAYIS